MADLDVYRPFDGQSITEAEWRTMARLWTPNGVDMTYNNGLQVYGDSSGRQVKVKTGRVWVDGFFGENTSEKTISLATNSSGNPRIDLIVAQVDPSTNKITIEVVQGTPAASPAIPSMTQSATGIYQVPLGYATLASGYSTVAAGDVTEYRQGAVGADANGQLRPWRTSWGVVGRASVTATQASITTITDVTSATVTWTAIANRSYSFQWLVLGESNNTASNITVSLTDGSNTQKAASRAPVSTASTLKTVDIDGTFVESGISAGSTTRKLRISADAGTVDIAASSTSPTQLTVIDIGPAIG